VIEFFLNREWTEISRKFPSDKSLLSCLVLEGYMLNERVNALKEQAKDE